MLVKGPNNLDAILYGVIWKNSTLFGCHTNKNVIHRVCYFRVHIRVVDRFYVQSSAIYCVTVENHDKWVNLWHLTHTWWRNAMEAFSALLAFCAGDRWIPRTKASDTELWYFFDLRLSKRLNKQSKRSWFETPSRSLWRHCNDMDCTRSWSSVWCGDVLIIDSIKPSKQKGDECKIRVDFSQVHLCFVISNKCVHPYPFWHYRAVRVPFDAVWCVLMIFLSLHFQ